MTGSAPNSPTARDDCGERVSANTTRPFSFEHRTNGRPIAPVAPATSILITAPLSKELIYGWSAQLRVIEAPPSTGKDGERDEGLCVSLSAHVPCQCDSIPVVGLDFGDQVCKLGFTPGADNQSRPLRRR